MADYLAPELATPGRPPDPLTDIYALGCTLYTTAGRTAAVCRWQPAAKTGLGMRASRSAAGNMGVPQPIGQLVAYLMAKNPTVRYQSATLVGRAAGDLCRAGGPGRSAGCQTPDLGGL